MGRAIMAEQKIAPDPQNRPPPAQQAGLVSLDSLLRMQAQLNYLRNAAPQKPVPQGTVAQDMEQQIQQVAQAKQMQEAMRHQGVGGLPAENIGDEQAYAAGGIIAFANRGAVYGDNSDESDEELVRKVASEAQAGNQGIAEFLKNIPSTIRDTVNPVAGLASFLRRNVKKDPDTGRYYVGDKPDHNYRTDKEAWSDYYKQNQGILSGASPSAEDLAAASKTMQVQRAPRIAPANTAAALTAAQDWQSNLGNFGPTSLEDRPKFAMGAPSGLQGIPVGAKQTDQAAPPARPAAPAKDPFAELDSQVAGQKSTDVWDEYEKVKGKFGESPAATKYSEFIDKLEADAGKRREEDKANALSRAGFEMAAAASQPGQAGSSLNKLLAAASAGGKSYANAMSDISKEQRATQQKIAEDRWKLADAAERNDRALFHEIYTNMRADERNMLTERMGILKLKIQEYGYDKRYAAETARITAAEKRAETREERAQHTANIQAITTSLGNKVRTLTTQLAGMVPPAKKGQNPQYDSLMEDLAGAQSSLDAYTAALAKSEGINLPAGKTSSVADFTYTPGKGLVPNK
jgi:hypothetical protein